MLPASWPAAAWACGRSWFLPAVRQMKVGKCRYAPISLLSHLSFSSIPTITTSPEANFLWHSTLCPRYVESWLRGYMWMRLKDSGSAYCRKLWIMDKGRNLRLGGLWGVHCATQVPPASHTAHADWRPGNSSPCIPGRPNTRRSPYSVACFWQKMHQTILTVNCFKKKRALNLKWNPQNTESVSRANLIWGAKGAGKRRWRVKFSREVITLSLRKRKVHITF